MFRVICFDAVSSYTILYVDYCCLEHATSDIVALHYVTQVCMLRDGV